MSDPIKARDQAAALALIDAMIGWTGVGVDSNGEAISCPTSPEVRAHLAAVLGDACMSYGNDAKPGRRSAMAAYLRSVADHLAGQDPQIAELAAASDDANARAADYLNRIGTVVAGINSARARGLTEQTGALLDVIEKVLAPDGAARPDNDHPPLTKAERDSIRDRVKADVESAVGSGAGVQAECNKILNEIAAERGVSRAEVLRDALDQMKAAHHG